MVLWADEVDAGRLPAWLRATIRAAVLALCFVGLGARGAVAHGWCDIEDDGQKLTHMYYHQELNEGNGFGSDVGSIVRIQDQNGNPIRDTRLSISPGNTNENCSKHGLRSIRWGGGAWWEYLKDLTAVSGPVGKYQVELSHSIGGSNPYVTKVAATFYYGMSAPMGDQGGTDLGALVVNVKNNGTPLAGALVTVRVQGKITGQLATSVQATPNDGTGQVKWSPISAGRADVLVEATIGGVLKKAAASFSIPVNNTLTINCELSTGTLSGTSPTTGGSSGTDMGPMLTNDWWSNLVHYLFYPSSSTLSQWDTFRQQVGSWGPFGVVSSLGATANTAARSGEQDLVFPVGFQFFGEGSAGWSGFVDLRPTGSEPLANGSAGTWLGDCIPPVRLVLGGFVWGLFLLWLIRRFMPRPQV